MTVGHNGVNAIRNGRAVWEPNPCGIPHHDHPETLCTEPAGHYQPERDPHAGPLIIDGRERGAAAWDEPKETTMADQPANQATEPDDMDRHVCKPGASIYYCPTGGETESDCHGGFDVCCARPDLHQPLLPCSTATLRQHPHGPHSWEPQPGMNPVHCEGYGDPAAADRPALENLDAAPESARCCVCGGAQVVYRNYLEQPFCQLCANCECAQNPCVRTGVGDPEVSESAEVQRLQRMIRQIMTGNRAAVGKLTDAHQATIGELRRAEARVRDLEATIERVRALLRQQWAAEGPPPGVSRWWDERLAELDEALESPASGAPVRHVHVTITNPDAYTADRAALSLVDWVRAEFGDSLNLHVTTDAREWGGDGQEQP